MRALAAAEKPGPGLMALAILELEKGQLAVRLLA
jgi:hypothetical protein